MPGGLTIQRISRAGGTTPCVRTSAALCPRRHSMPCSLVSADVHHRDSPTVVQAIMVKEICTAILRHTLKLNNCFETLETGLQAGIPSLIDTALGMACINYSQALLQDHSGWAALSQKGVLLVLCSNKLQVWSTKFSKACRNSCNLSVNCKRCINRQCA